MNMNRFSVKSASLCRHFTFLCQFVTFMSSQTFRGNMYLSKTLEYLYVANYFENLLLFRLIVLAQNLQKEKVV